MRICRPCRCITAASPAQASTSHLAQAVAEGLGRRLEIQWFESKLDEDSSPALEANALLSDGRCSLRRQLRFHAGFAGRAGREDREAAGFRRRHPRRPPPARRDRRSRADQALYVLVADGCAGPQARDRQIAGIGDLSGLRLAIESGTLGDAILMTFDKGRLIDSITHLVPGARRPARVRSNRAASMRRCSTSGASMPTGPHIPTRH